MKSILCILLRLKKGREYMKIQLPSITGLPMQTPVKDKGTAKTWQRAAERASATAEQSELSDAQKLSLFKQEISTKLETMLTHGSVHNVAVDISDAGFKAMMEDPAYCEQMLGLIQRDIGSSYVPCTVSVSIRIGETAEQYRADSWSTSNDAEFWGRSASSFWTKTSDRRRASDAEALWKKRQQYTQQQAALMARLMRSREMQKGTQPSAPLDRSDSYSGSSPASLSFLI